MRFRSAVSLWLLLALILAPLLPAQSGQAAEDSPQATPDAEIVYIDGAGFIRVIDPNVAAGTQEIRWSSPEGNWFDFDVADVNNDGDQEILAIGYGTVTVFDPVVRDASVPTEGVINLVPWARLNVRALPGAPSLIGGGNMDWNVPGDEIIVGYSVNEPNNIRYRLEVLKSPDGGRTWTSHLNKGFGAPWKSVDVGQVNNAGSSDIALVREPGALFDVREIDNDFRRIFDRDDADIFNPVDAVIGNVYAGGLPEVIYARNYAGTDEQPSLLIYQNVNNSWQVVEDRANFKTDDSAHYAVHPTHLIAADINGSGDDEIIVLRGVASTAQFARIFMINRGGDAAPKFENFLDQDGGFKVGDGGDTDADGREEIVIMRNNRIIHYYAVESGNSNLFTDYTGITTNSRSLKLANLDGEGYIAGTRFVATPDKIEATLPAGQPGGAPINIDLSTTGLSANTPFVLEREGNPIWYSVTPSANQTSANLAVFFNASAMAPGVYTSRIKVTSPNEVINQPYYIDVKLTVTQAEFSLNPASASFAFSKGESTSESVSFEVKGLLGLKFSAALVPKPEVSAAAAALGGQPYRGYLNDEGNLVLVNEYDEPYVVETLGEVSASAATWPSAYRGVEVLSVDDQVPDTITVRVAPQNMDEILVRALLIVIADERAGQEPENIVMADVVILREAESQSYLPSIRR